MTKEQLAEMLNGRQYGDETTPEIERLAKENGLCIAFGASDDLLEFRGSVYDEAGAYNGTVVYLSKKGNVKEETYHSPHSTFSRMANCTAGVACFHLNPLSNDHKGKDNQSRNSGRKKAD